MSSPHHHQNAPHHAPPTHPVPPYHAPMSQQGPPQQGPPPHAPSGPQQPFPASPSSSAPMQPSFDPVQHRRPLPGAPSIPPDIVVFPRRGRAQTQLLVSLGIGAVFLVLTLAILYAAIVDGQWPFLLAIPIMVLAMAGLLIDQNRNRRRARSVQSTIPVLAVTAQGIGDGFLQVPWPMVRGVEVLVHVGRQGGTGGIGRSLGDALTSSAGVLDGEFVLRVQTASPPPSHLVRPGAHRVERGAVVYDLGTAIPAGHWYALADGIRAHAQARGVPMRNVSHRH